MVSEAPNPNAPQRNYIDYTLTSSDYKKIACMKANVQKAKAAGVEEQLAEMGSKGCFNEVITVREYIPAWLDSIANTPTSVFKSAVANTTARITYENAVVDETQVPFTPQCCCLDYFRSRSGCKCGSDRHLRPGYDCDR